MEEGAIEKSPSSETLDASDRRFECPVCVSFFVEPLTLACGHSFCRACLLQSTRLAPDGRCCPLCRAAVSIRDPATAPQDAKLAEAVKGLVDRDAYSARLAADRATIAEVLDATSRLLPIFACFPGTAVGRPVALHFFEPRYKVLIRRAWEGNRLFAYTGVQPRPGAEGVVVRIEEARFLRDGRANVVGVGVAAITLGEVWVEDGTHGLNVTRLPPSCAAWLPERPARPPLEQRRCTVLRCTCAVM